MPLCESKIKPQSWEEIKEQFAIFYASKGDDGIMWCPVRWRCYSGSGRRWFSILTLFGHWFQDCRAVKDLIEETFDKEEAPSALIIYVGQKPE